MMKRTFDWLAGIVSLALLSPILCSLAPAYASPKTLLLLPLRIYADESKSYLGQGVKSMLLSRLSGGDMEVLSGEKVAHLLSEEEKDGITAQNRAEELARSLEVDYAVFGSITVIGAGYSLDLSLLKVENTGSTVTRISKAMNEDQFIPELSEVANQVRAAIEGKEVPTPSVETKPEVLPESGTAKGIFTRIGEEEPPPGAPEKGVASRAISKYQEFRPTRTLSVDMPIMAFDTGDLDGDGTVELVVLGRKALKVYKRQGPSFALKDTLKHSFGEEFLTVSVGDVDGNGKPEIYVVGLSGQRAQTTVLEWAGGFNRLCRETGRIRAV